MITSQGEASGTETSGRPYLSLVRIATSVGRRRKMQVKTHPSPPHGRERALPGAAHCSTPPRVSFPETRRTPAVLPAAAVAMETGPPTRLDCHRGGSSGRCSSIPRSRVRRGEALCVACQALLGHCTTVCLWCHGEITLLYNLMRL